ncbi:COG1123 ATPase components of various ABC-type transport systems, contain duplicated ATPase [Burkholderiaceae bacterium]
MDLPQATPLLEVKDLVVEFPSRRGVLRALDGVSFSVAAGEVLGVVGESGAGKSLTGASIIGLLEPPGRIASGSIWFDGQRIDNLDAEGLRRLRGRHIGAIFQDPLTSLNPLYSVGQQLVETIQAHLPVSTHEARERAVALLQETGIAAARERLDHYPHQFSGGMRQRVVIALALAAEPRLIVADEPTTALDVSVQAQIIGLLKRLCRERGAAVVLITHDMGVIAETCDRVAVMYAGRVAEIGPVDAVIHRSAHPYSAGLMASIPDIDGDDERLHQIDGSMPRLNAIPSGCAYHPRCAHALPRCAQQRPELQAVGQGLAACWLIDANAPAHAMVEESLASAMAGAPAARVAPANGTVQFTGHPDHRASAAGPQHPTPLVQVRDLARHFDVSAPWLNRLLEGQPRQWLHAVDGVDFAIPRGQTMALVGESGCGKSTVARLLVGLYQPSRGQVQFDGQDAHAAFAGRDALALRRRIQMIFQDPYASLNPRWTVGDVVAEPLLEHGLAPSRAAAQDAVVGLLQSVGLGAADLGKYPHQFSGGQRQRISIARALATAPEFLVCDEPTSALDVSVQAQVLNLMGDLQRARGLTYLFISHNLAVVRHVSDQVGVMYLGRLVEVAPTRRLFAQPRHPYTRMLIDAIPRMRDHGRERTPVQGEVPNPLQPPTGCSFHPRCPWADARCRSERPVLQTIDGVQVACHAVQEGRPL